ncbi:MAG: glycosyltransferase family 4 protein [Chloroflexi bacterium]|nr:glycosyltransferase family 4 protein [Chloroflexota bacterium]
MRILLVVSGYRPQVGGLQSATAHLAVGLQRRGSRVSVLTQRFPRSMPPEEEIDGVKVQRWHFIVPRLRDLSHGRIDLFIAGLLFFPITSLRLFARIARDKPDVVNLHFVGAPALFLLAVRALKRFRYVVSLHGDDVEGLSRRSWLDRRIFRATLRRADTVTACSQYLLDRALEIEPQIGPKSRVIYNGIDMPSDRLGRNCGASVLCVGRLVPSKGFDLLLRAAALCGRDGQEFNLTLIGDGPERARLKMLGREMGITGNLEFRGACDHAAVSAALSASRLVVVPSRKDSFGLVALEAMAAGKPVVATHVGGLPEVLDGADAVLVLPDDPEALAEAIVEILRKLERNPDFGARNRELAARFSTSRMVDAYEAVYAGVAPSSA